MTPKPSGLAGLAHLPEKTPIFMLNMIKYHETAQYTSTTSSQTPAPGEPITGQQAYFNHYIPAFRAIAARLGGQSSLHYLGDAMVNVVVTDPGEDWDVLILVRYADKQAFEDIVRSDEYAVKAKPHREAAVKEWKLIATVEKGLGA